MTENDKATVIQIIYHETTHITYMIYGRVCAVNSPRQGLGLSHWQLRKISCEKYDGTTESKF